MQDLSAVGNGIAVILRAESVKGRIWIARHVTVPPGVAPPSTLALDARALWPLIVVATRDGIKIGEER